MTDPDEIGTHLEVGADALERLYAIVAEVDTEHLSADEWLEVRAKVGVEWHRFNRASNEVARSLGLESASGRLLRFLQLRLRTVVDKDELSGVASIHEWARRIRELRVEKGWPISSSETRDDLAPGQYLLEGDAPDEDLAEDWRIAKTIRNQGGGASGRVLAYLKAIHPRSADKEQLRYVANIQEWPRRMRELAEQGWQIVSNIDDPSLKPGEYRLAALEQLPPRAREAIKLRYEVLSRDKFTCLDCGRSPRTHQVQLQVHHIVLVSEGGTNDESNLRTLCSQCHAGAHAVHVGSTGDELLDPSSEPPSLGRAN
jgi:hypothetical protein